jgi:hypothetical protein
VTTIERQYDLNKEILSDEVSTDRPVVTGKLFKSYMWIKDIQHIEKISKSFGKKAEYEIKNILEEKCHIGGLNKSDIANS